MSKLIIVNNLGCPTYKGNSVEFLVEFWFKKNYPLIKSICWDLLALIKSNSRNCYTYSFKGSKYLTKIHFFLFEPRFLYL
jgi:hypothetical protein